jgi:hypothetical protein
MTVAGREALGKTDYARFRELIQSSSGIELSEVRRSDLERAVARTVERTSLSGPAELYTHLSAGDNTVDRETFIAELTIGETYFFRHRAQFEVLERHILPELIARRANERRLRVWSAGCHPARPSVAGPGLVEREDPRHRHQPRLARARAAGFVSLVVVPRSQHRDAESLLLAFG